MPLLVEEAATGAGRRPPLVDLHDPLLARSAWATCRPLLHRLVAAASSIEQQRRRPVVPLAASAWMSRTRGCRPTGRRASTGTLLTG